MANLKIEDIMKTKALKLYYRYKRNELPEYFASMFTEWNGNHSHDTRHKSLLYQLEQLERLRSEDTPRRLMITHTIGSQVKKIIDLELKTLQSRHDFQSQGQITLKI